MNYPDAYAVWATNTIKFSLAVHSSKCVYVNFVAKTLADMSYYIYMSNPFTPATVQSFIDWTYTPATDCGFPKYELIVIPKIQAVVTLTKTVPGGDITVVT